MNNFKLSKAIARLRKAQKISQAQMSKDLGISRVTITALENATAQDVGIKKVIKVLDYLGHQLEIRPKTRMPTLEDLQNE